MKYWLLWSAYVFLSLVVLDGLCRSHHDSVGATIVTLVIGFPFAAGFAFWMVNREPLRPAVPPSPME